MLALLEKYRARHYLNVFGRAIIVFFTEHLTDLGKLNLVKFAYIVVWF